MNGPVRTPLLRRVVLWALLACAAVLALSYLAAGSLMEYLKHDLAGRGINYYSQPGDLYSVWSIAARKILYMLAVAGSVLALSVWVGRKWPAVPKAATSAPLAGLVAGYAAGALISGPAFETMAGEFSPAIAGSLISVGGYISFMFNMILFTGISSGLFVLFITLFVSVRWKFRALFLLPALADAFYFYVWTCPIVR